MSMRRVDSRISGPLMRMPSWAPRPVPASSAVGVASPSAHGQATTSTATAAESAVVGAWPLRSQPTKVSAATTSTTGTKTADTRSASRCTGALPVWAASTSRVIPASVVSAPTASARTRSVPVELIVPPTTWSPGPTSTGTDSPVTREVSTALRPSTTTPSVATFSPGRTRKSIPTCRSSMSIRS